MGIRRLVQAVLHTGEMTEERIKDQTPEALDCDVRNFAKIYSLLDGQMALVLLSPYGEGDAYIFIGLLDAAMNKEVTYLLEQGSYYGCYINQREEFDRDYDSGNHSCDVTFCKDKGQVEVVIPDIVRDCVAPWHLPH